MTTTIPDSQTLTREAADLQTQAAALVITDGATFARAGAMLLTIKAYLKRVGEAFDPVVDAAHRAHKAAVEQRAKYRDEAFRAEATLKQRMGEYEREQERQRRAAEEARRREQERLEREQRERERAEADRLRREEEERRLAEASDAEARGDTETAERLLEAPIVVNTPPAAPVFVPPVQVERAPRVEGVSFRTDYDFEVVNPELLPREYLQPDEKKIRGVVRALGMRAVIPGVRVIEKRVVAARA